MSVWFNPEPEYDCIFVMWQDGSRWVGETETPEVLMKVKMRRGWKPEESDWIYIGEF